MKKILTTLVLVLITNLVIGQGYYNSQTGVFHTKVKNGVGVEKPFKFKMTRTTFQSINGPVQLIDNEIVHLVEFLKSTLKNQYSFDVVENTMGNIDYVEGEIHIEFYYTAQNGYGNTLVDRFSTQHRLDILEEIESNTERSLQLLRDIAESLDQQSKIDSIENLRNEFEYEITSNWINIVDIFDLSMGDSQYHKLKYEYHRLFIDMKLMKDYDIEMVTLIAKEFIEKNLIQKK